MLPIWTIRVSDAANIAEQGFWDTPACHSLCQSQSWLGGAKSQVGGGALATMLVFKVAKPAYTPTGMDGNLPAPWSCRHFSFLLAIPMKRCSQDKRATLEKGTVTVPLKLTDLR